MSVRSTKCNHGFHAWCFGCGCPCHTHMERPRILSIGEVRRRGYPYDVFDVDDETNEALDALLQEEEQPK